MQSNGDSMMEKFEKPELLNFLCDKEPDIFESQGSTPVEGGDDGGL